MRDRTLPFTRKSYALSIDLCGETPNISNFSAEIGVEEDFT